MPMSNKCPTKSPKYSESTENSEDAQFQHNCPTTVKQSHPHPTTVPASTASDSPGGIVADSPTDIVFPKN